MSVAAFNVFFVFLTVVNESVLLQQTPTLEGQWQIVGNNFPGVLELHVSADNQLSGQIYGERITGIWDVKKNRFEFTRYRDNRGIQVWTGELKEGTSGESGKVAELKGTYRSIAGAEFGAAGKDYDWSGSALAKRAPVEPCFSGQTDRSLVGHSKSVTEIAWSSDSSTLVSGSDDRSICIWEVATGTLKSKFPELVTDMYGGPVFCFTADLKTAAISYWGNVSIRPLSDGKLIREIDPILDRKVKSTFRPDVYAMSYSPDGKLLATAGSQSGQGLPRGVVTIWQVDSSKPLYIFDQLETAAGAIVWSADGSRVVFGTNGVGGELPSPGEVHVWNVSNGKQEHAFKVKPKPEYGEWASAGDVAFSPDGKSVAVTVTSGSRSSPAGLIIQDGGTSIRVWDLATGQASDTVVGLKSSISRIRYSPDGKQIAGIGNDQSVRVWDARTGRETQSCKLLGEVTSLAFDPSGKILAVGQKDGRISLVPVRANP